MCASMVDIQSATVEIRRGKKERRRKKKKKKEETTGQKYNGPLLHRAAINILIHTNSRSSNLLEHLCCLRTAWTRPALLNTFRETLKLQRSRFMLFSPCIFSERELTFTFAICYRPSVCLSVVCRLSVCRLGNGTR